LSDVAFEPESCTAHDCRVPSLTRTLTWLFWDGLVGLNPAPEIWSSVDLGAIKALEDVIEGAENGISIRANYEKEFSTHDSLLWQQVGRLQSRVLGQQLGQQRGGAQTLR
jgi:hypothetical protein